jgi:choice-of-anchor B domain-containing protein
MAFVPLATFGASSANDIWGWTDSLDGKEYALIGLSNGTGFVDITDPENPVYLGRLPTHTSNSSWRDIKVYNNYAFIVSEAGGHGMQVFDLTELRSVASPPEIFANTNHYDDFGSSHNIAINEDSGYAYAVGTSTCSGGLHMINIQNPLSLVNAGCVSSDGYTHDTQCVNYIGPDLDYQGAEICFSSNEDTLTIIDVTNKAAPDQISRTGYTGWGYTHQGWATGDHRYFLLGDEGDEFDNGHGTRTYIWDLLDLDNPVLLNNYTAATASVDHNLYIIGDFAYESNYSSGLRILDISDIGNANLTEVAFFDTYPANNNPSYNGTWSNYPYFDSGNIVVSGIDEGLFVVRPTIALGTLVRNEDTIEETVVMGDSVTRTLMVSNTGTVAIDFTVSEGAAWAEVSPSGGTLDPGEAMALSVVFVSSATAGAGTYNDALSFSGTFDNNPADVDLILHVTNAGAYSMFLPARVGNGGGNVVPPGPAAPTAALPWLFPALGFVAVAGLQYGLTGRNKRSS